LLTCFVSPLPIKDPLPCYLALCLCKLSVFAKVSPLPALCSSPILHTHCMITTR
jgi:hypothetical protein